MHRRFCMYNCGTELTACFGFTLARDVVAFLEGRIKAEEVREMCGRCNFLVGLGRLPLPSWPDESALVYMPDEGLLALEGLSS